MRRFHALLIAAGLAAAPTSAVAGPSTENSWATSQTVERFEWSTSKGRLGVLVMSLTPELRAHFGAESDRGVLVARVEPGTPAAAAGLAVGDVIAMIHGTKIDGAPDVLTALAGSGKQDVEIRLVRGGKPLTLHAKLSDPKQAEARDWLRSLRELLRPPMPADGVATVRS